METVTLLDSNRFAGCWNAIQGVEASPSRVLDTLRMGYVEAHRAYHHAEHIRDCSRWLAVMVDSAGKAQAQAQAQAVMVDIAGNAQAQALAVASDCNDAVHQPIASDNGARSAGLFWGLAVEAGGPACTVGRIVQPSEATARWSR